MAAVAVAPRHLLRKVIDAKIDQQFSLGYCPGRLWGSSVCITTTAIRKNFRLIDDPSGDSRLTFRTHAFYNLYKY